MTTMAANTETTPKFTLSDLTLPIMNQEWRKLTASFGHLLTTGIASAVVMALFVYIFGDFLVAKLPTINSDLANESKFYFTLGLIMFGAIGFARWTLKILYATHGWLNYLNTLGCEPHTLKKLALTTSLISQSIGMLVICVAAERFLGPLAFWHLVIAVLLIPISIFYFQHRATTPPARREEAPHSCQSCVEEPLVSWRSSRLMSNTWRGSKLRILAALPIVFGTTALATGKPKELTYLACLLGGIILSWTVPLLIEEDLHFTWVERQAAVSHQTWIQAWQRIFSKWVPPLFITTVILYVIAAIIAGNKDDSLTNWQVISDITGQAILAGLLAAFPVWLAPSFVLQIDGKRILTNVIMLTLINVFVGTALMAAPLLAPALWLLHREAHRYQEGRFARAANH